MPTPEETSREEELRLVFIDESHDAQDEARDSADNRLNRELGEGGGLKKFVNGIWKGNIAKDYYRQKYVSQALEAIYESNNVLANSPTDRRKRATESTIQRFQGEYEELIHTEAGEKREVHTDDSQLVDGVKQMVRSFVEGHLDATGLKEERTRLLQNHYHGAEADASTRERGIATVDNLLEIAQAVVGVVEHGESLDNALGRLQVVTGEARNGARTEARYTSVDKGIDWLSKRGVASFLTPGALAVGVAAAASIARVGSHSVVGAVTKTLLPGVAAGLWAGLRENKRTKDERSEHARGMAVGENFEEGDKRRVEMEENRYETISATDLIGHLNTVGDKELLSNGSEAVQAAMDALAAIQARVQFSDSKKIDLISYSDKADVGEERMMLDLARREVRLALEANLTEDVRTALGLEQDKDVKELLQQRADWFAEDLTEDMSEKDQVFSKLKRRRVAKAAAIGVATGIIGGLVVQEAVAAVDPTRFGLIDMIRGDTPVAYEDGLVHQTILEGMVRGDETTVHTGASDSYETYGTAPNGSIELSDDHALETNPDGTLNLVDKNGQASVEGLVVDSNGTFDQASLDKLDGAGMVVEDASFNTVETNTVSEQVSTNQYLQNHLSETTKVERDLWYGNDTPDVYDGNELRLYRGGSADAPGLVDGGYQYSVAGMEARGSFQGGEDVDWNQASENGNLFAAVSGTYDSQGNPFMVPIGPDGTINIPADSPAGQFFANEGDSAAFKGAYMEIVQTTGVDADGTVHVRPLATLVGDGSINTITDTVTTETLVPHAEYAITTNGFDTTQSNFTEMAPITPVASRRSMESFRTEDLAAEAPISLTSAPEAINGYNYGELLGANREEFSPQLRNNPEAQLDLRKELGWFKDELSRREGEDYAAEIQNIVEITSELAPNAQPLRSIITVPVAAAYESENIYGTLSLYAQQDEDKLASNLIILNTNWLDIARQDPESARNIQKTLSEIERAKADFPSLRIASFTKEYESEEVKKTGGPIGYVVSDLFNVALLTLEQYAEANPTADLQDVAIIRQDADMEGISRHYLRNVEKAVDSSEADIFNGVIRSGVRMQTRYPGIGIVTNFSQAIQVARAQQNQPWTVGINTVIRASTLAAVGGLGKRGNWSGPGSDDIQVGQRVQIARQNGGGAEFGSSAYYEGILQPAKPIGRKIVTQVSGLTVDSSALRLIPQYLLGRHFGAAWNGNISGDSGFAAGPGGYQNREEFARDVMKQIPKDKLDDDNFFKFINANITAELVNNAASDPDGIKIAQGVMKKTLAVFFGSVPGAYVINGELGDRSQPVSFELTETGKQFLKGRVQRETNGSFGAYGFRKMRQLYGVTTGKRQPAAAESPLVSPVG